MVLFLFSALGCFAAEKVIKFNADYSVTAPKLFVGDDVVLKYDLKRAKCGHYEKWGFDTWKVDVTICKDGICDWRYPYAYYEAGHPNVLVDETKFTAKKDFEVYFRCWNFIENYQYDSNYGNNWKFTVNKPESSN